MINLIILFFLGYFIMVFNHPNWIEGLFLFASIIIIPLVISVSIALIGYIRGNDKLKWMGIIFIILSLVIFVPMSSVIWHYNYEVPSVQSKIITVRDWQPKPHLAINDNGMMVIDSADDLMLVTSEDESFLNEENFLFEKFNTRDILNTLNPGGTYNITYYGWREGFNSGFPNILKVEEVVDESHAVNKDVGDYFGTKVI